MNTLPNSPDMFPNRWFLALCWSVMIIAGCTGSPAPSAPGADCDIPAPGSDGSFGPPIPRYTHIRQRLSSSGKELLYLGQSSASLKILNLQNGVEEAISLRDKLPSNVSLLTVENAIWSPYSDDRILLLCVTFTEVAGSSRPKHGLNLYVLHRTLNELERITPEQFGPAGSTEGFFVRLWLKGSGEASDSIYMGPHRGVFLPQTNQFVTGDRRNLIAQSRDGLHYIGVDYQAMILDPRIDGRSLPLPFELRELNKASFSPDGRYVALWVDPVQSSSTILIYDLADYLKSGRSPGLPREIDLSRQHCSLSSLGSYPEFISDSTLAVSMHRYGASTSELWEIGVNGSKVRQLTFGSN